MWKHNCFCFPHLAGLWLLIFSSCPRSFHVHCSGKRLIKITTCETQYSYMYIMHCTWQSHYGVLISKYWCLVVSEDTHLLLNTGLVILPSTCTQLTWPVIIFMSIPSHTMLSPLDGAIQQPMSNQSTLLQEDGAQNANHSCYSPRGILIWKCHCPNYLHSNWTAERRTQPEGHRKEEKQQKSINSFSVNQLYLSW